MKSSAKKWLKGLIKFAVCAGALLYLSTKVTLEDYVRLADAPQEKHLLLSKTRVLHPDARLLILDADTGIQREVSPADLAKQVDLKKDQRPIELGLKTVLRSADWSWASWALLVFAPIPAVMAWRLRNLLETQDIHITYRDALLLTVAGNFFNFAMPGTTGGDIYKAYHIAKRTHKRTEGVTVVILDRVVGLLSFLLIAAGAIFAASGTDIVGQFGRWVGYLLCALIAAGLLFFSKRMRRLIHYDTWLEKLPFANKLKRIDETAFSFRYHYVRAASSLIVTVAAHFVLVTSIYFLARSLGISPNLGRDATALYLAVLISTVVGYLFAAIPISIQGFGLLEAVFWKVLVDGQWSNASQMLALTLGARLVQVVWSLPGVLVPWMGLERPPAAESAPTADTPERLSPQQHDAAI